MCCLTWPALNAAFQTSCFWLGSSISGRSLLSGLLQLTRPLEETVVFKLSMVFQFFVGDTCGHREGVILKVVSLMLHSTLLFSPSAVPSPTSSSSSSSSPLAIELSWKITGRLWSNHSVNTKSLYIYMRLLIHLSLVFFVVLFGVLPLAKS